MGIPKEEMSGHGLRAMPRTLLDEVLGFRFDFIEHHYLMLFEIPMAVPTTAHINWKKEKK